MGRTHALLLASRGARVVVNDYGGSLGGVGSDASIAEAVVAEIKQAGGEAAASCESVHSRQGGEAIIDSALSRYGRVDILVNNAGILNSEPFDTFSEDTWRRTLSVNLDGAMWVTHAAWPHMKKSGYGRVVFVTSTAGLMGTANLLAYGVSKAGIFGLMRGLMHEVGTADLKLNAILPGATTRMAGDATEEMIKRGHPALVSPIVAYLASVECKENGEAYVAGAGFFGRVQLMHGHGVRFGWDAPISPEQVAEHWDGINAMTDVRTYPSMEAHAVEWFQNGADR
jgi:NAD(P)-dependent dehydrogenase (short-subunit alcohol dehydrogenase family)